LIRKIAGDDAPLELDGTAACLFVQHVVVIEHGHARTESYTYRLQADASQRSWLIRWEYEGVPRTDNAYPRAHVHVNGKFPDQAVIGALHIPTRMVSLELVLRHLITDWDVKPRSRDWEAILDESDETSAKHHIE
jgi:hypothetical protein